jgi:hypothetical protein
LNLPDRASSVSFVDLDNDGVEEMFIATSDSCRLPRLFRRTSTREWERLRNAGLELLAGIPDVAWVDVDRDGRIDAVGYRGSALKIALNRSLQSSSQLRAVTIPEAATQNTAMYSVRDAETVKNSTGSTGRGRGVHERAPLLVATHSDTIVVRKETASGVSEIRIKSLPAASAVSAAAEQSAGCSVVAKPNPFGTHVDFISSGDAEVIISVLTVDGQLLWTDRTRPGQGSSQVSWNGRSADGNVLANGLYVVRMQTDTCVNVVTIVKVQ